MEIGRTSHNPLIGRLLGGTILGFLLLLFLTPMDPIALSPPPKSVLLSQDRDRIIHPNFVDRTLESGLSFAHQQGDEQLAGIDETLGPGACALDYDNDGWVDLFLVNGSGQTRYYGKPYWWQRGQGNALFKNVDGKYFREVTQEAGLAQLAWGMGCVTADLDNDGDTDLLVTNRGENQLFRNEGNGRFTNVTADSGISGEHWSASASVADFNGDGLPDIYIANYVEFRKGAHTYETNSQFAEDLPPSFQGSLYQPQSKLLYQNLGNLQFKDVTAELNADNREGRSLGVAWFDGDGDGWMDVYLANDRGVASNTLLRNRQGQRFDATGTLSGLQSSSGHRGISLGDVNNDGLIDVVVATEKGNSPLLMIRGHDASAAWFSDQARDYGVDQETYVGLSGWSPGLADFNNDGWTDLFLTNGLVMPDPDTHRVPQGQPKQLWLNTGKRGFMDAVRASDVALKDTQSARGAVFADFDNDGDMDVYITHNNDLGQLLINELPSASHWLGIQLVGDARHRDAVGARVVVDASTGLQARQVTQGSGFLSDSDQRLHFGLGAHAEIKGMKVFWPDGAKQEFTDIPVDRYVRVTQDRQVLETLTTGMAGTDTTRQPLKLAFGAEDADNRASYLELLTQIAGIDQAFPELEKAVHDEDATVRNKVMQLLSEHKTSKASTLLTAGLEDDNPDVAAAAVNGLCGYEDENTVRWLLRAFNKPQPQIKTALAHCFDYYFQEEEAVVHRKYLALSPLIRLLEDPDPQVAIAAAGALAKAERYRAVAPLTQLLGHSTAEVRAAGMRALGLIRDGKAIPAILTAVSQADQDPQVYAQGIIALKRLSHGEFEQLLREFVFGTGRFDAIPVQVRLRAMNRILADPEGGVVINPDQIVSLVLAWAEERHLELQKDASPSDWAPLLIENLQHAKLNNQPAQALLSSLTSHPASQVRVLALTQFMQGNRQELPQVLRSAWSDAKPEVRIAVLRSLKDQKSPPTLSEQFIFSAMESAPTRLVALEVAYLAPGPLMTKKLTDITNAPASSAEEVKAALLSLEKLGVNARISKALLQHGDAEIRRIAFACWADQLPKNLSAENLPEEFTQALNDPEPTVRAGAVGRLAIRQELWAKRAIARYLADQKADLPLRRELLRVSNVEANQNVLLGIALDGRYDPMQNEIIENLLNANSGFADALALRLLKDSKSQTPLRMKAAKSLAPRTGKAVLAILQKS